MLRLDPALPPLWRTADVMQFGVPAVVCLDSPMPWQERMVEELVGGIAESAWAPVASAFGAPDGAAADLLERLRPALGNLSVPVPPPIALHVPATIPPADASSFVRTLDAIGMPHRAWQQDEPPNHVEPQEVVVMLTPFLVDPVAAGRLMRDDIPHIPVVLAGRSIRIGPLVRPGVTACAICTQTHLQGDDPAWPALASQLVQRSAPPSGPALLAEAALTCARMLTVPMPDALLVTLEAGEHRRSIAACSPHPRCSCRSLGGTSTAVAPVDRPHAPTTWRASARRG
jgi:hypothetical protein